MIWGRDLLSAERYGPMDEVASVTIRRSSVSIAGLSAAMLLRVGGGDQGEEKPKGEERRELDVFCRASACKWRKCESIKSCRVAVLSGPVLALPPGRECKAGV